MINQQTDWFGVSDYWGNWSRSFVRGGGQGYLHTVEMSVSPTNASFSSDCNELKLACIRVHMTPRANKDWHHHLPDHIAHRLEDKLGKDWVNFLLNDDIHGRISTEQARRKMALFNRFIPCGGGIPLAILDSTNKLVRDYWKDTHSGQIMHYKGWMQNVLDLPMESIDTLDIWIKLTELEKDSLGYTPPATWKGMKG